MIGLRIVCIVRTAYGVATQPALIQRRTYQRHTFGQRKVECETYYVSGAFDIQGQGHRFPRAGIAGNGTAVIIMEEQLIV